MPLYTGQHGSVRHRQNDDGTGGGWEDAAQVRNWQINFQSPTITTTTLGSQWQERIPGVKSATGTCEINYFRGQNNGRSTASHWLDRLYDNQSADDRDYAVQFMLTHGSNTQTVQINAYITNITVSCSVGEVVTLQATFESDGEPPEMTF